MKLAVVAGGWHWPAHFFWEMAEQASGAALFVIAHRSPELPIVREEKLPILSRAKGVLAEFDRMLYARYPSIAELRGLQWVYEEEANTVGDWGFLNQWLELHDYRQYDCILSCHDDTFIRRRDLLDQAQMGSWLILANGTYPQAPAGYVRGSFEFFARELLDMLGGRIDLGPLGLTREGKTGTPYADGNSALSAWNDTGIPLRRFLVERGLAGRVSYLSRHYRVSPWAIEGERGFMHFREGAPWSLEEGLMEHVVEANP